FLVDAFPLPDTKKEVSVFETAGGGPVATALVSLSRLGVTCSFAGIVGDDEAGEKIRKSLEEDRVDVRGLVTRRQAASQVAFICVEQKSGRRTIYWKRPSGEPLKPDDIPGDFLAGPDFLLLDGLMPEASLYAAEKARIQNTPVMLDAGRVREGMIELACLSDYIVASEEFARDIAGGDAEFDPEHAVRKMTSFNARAVTVTLGSRGSITRCGSEIFRTPAFSVDAVDTTGAGDVFHGGYIYSLLMKWDMRRVLRFASAFAALKCRKVGGRAGIPSLQETERFLRENKE
ncbi:MAG: hypothetical protein JSU90_06165, partial [Nitrospiraceae bacterium]